MNPDTIGRAIDIIQHEIAMHPPQPATIPPWLYSRTDLTAEDKWHYLHLCKLAGSSEWKADRKLMIATMGIDADGDIVVYRRFKRLVEGGLISIYYEQESGPYSRGYRNVWTFRIVPHEEVAL